MRKTALLFNNLTRNNYMHSFILTGIKKTIFLSSGSIFFAFTS